MTPEQYDNLRSEIVYLNSEMDSFAKHLVAIYNFLGVDICEVNGKVILKMIKRSKQSKKK